MSIYRNPLVFATDLEGAQQHPCGDMLYRFDIRQIAHRRRRQGPEAGNLELEGLLLDTIAMQ